MSKTTVDIKLSDTITGLTNTSWDRDNIVSGRAATEDQLKAATLSMADFYSTLDGLANEYYIGDSTDVDAFVANLGAISRVAWGVARSAPLVLTAELQGDWSGPDAEGYGYITADVTATFPDGSTVSRGGIVFKNDYHVADRVYAVKLGEGALGVDTGLTLDYSYIFIVKAMVPEGVMGAPIGAFESSSMRTTIRLLGGSNKAQIAWPSIVDIVASDYQNRFTLREMCEIRASGDRNNNFLQGDNWWIVQNGETIINYTSNWTASGTGSAHIYLLNEQLTENYKNAILREARIYKQDGTLLRMFQGARRNGEVVIVDAVTDTVYRPDAGVLEEVTQ